ncbi:metallophosphoesterase [uncultured Corynebacterium sp.]|uniref:metallophosphoesterase family protein n=1 Tax=uncultured Corynebacterium sp. TaxID=159447 RepID=UPI0025DD07DB|nr:metallophosphoesterase [uncultured Corynebacterium sp.]
MATGEGTSTGTDGASRTISRRTALAGGAAGIGALLAASAASVVPKARAARTGGIEATDLEVVTVTPTSVTFGFASYTAPHPAYGPLRPTVPTLGEVAMAPADDPVASADPVGSSAMPGPSGSWIRPGMPELPVVAGSPSETGFHLVTVDGLEPGREYVFECRCDGVPATPGLLTTNRPGSPEITGRVTTLTPPPGDHVTTIAILNDTHVGEEKHGLVLGDFPEAIVQEPGLPPFPEIMLASALAEIRDRGVERVFVNGDTTSEARPAEVRRFREIMDGFGEFGVDYHVTRGNHDRPHTPDSDPDAGYGDHPVLEGTDDHRDPWGETFVPRQTMWRTDVGGLRVLGLDTSMLDDSGGTIDDAQFAELEAELAADPNRPTLLMAHHPVTVEAAFTNVGTPAFTLNLDHSDRLQRMLAAAPGAFFMAAGHTHRVRRTAPDAADNVDFVELGSAAGYPGGYTLVHVHTGGYRVNFHRTGSPEALRWSSRSRWAMYGLNPEYTLGSTEHRNYVVERDLGGAA